MATGEQMKSWFKVLPLVVILGGAFAATIWPFMMSVYYPNITRADDVNSEFRYGSVLPRLYMGTSVSNIKQGDIVRIIYPNGEIWDMETSFQCSHVSTIPCPYRDNGTRVQGPTAPATPSKYSISVEMKKESARCQAGGGSSGYIPISTGYWASSGYTDKNGVVQVIAGWVYTGITYVHVYWSNPYPKMCP